MRRVALGMLVLVVLAGGCRRGYGRASTPVPRSLSRVAQHAQREMHCDRIDQVLYVLPGVVQVRGCGERQEYVLAPRRGPPMRIERIENVAERELGCDAAHITIASPAPSVRATTGCARRARYDLRCADRHCAWTMTAHAGHWTGIVASTPEVPEQFQVRWEAPPLVETSGAPAVRGESELDSVVLPAPPGSESESVVPSAPSP